MVKTGTLAVGGLALATTLASATPVLYERNNNGSGKKNIILGWTDGSKRSYCFIPALARLGRCTRLTATHL